MLGQTKQIDVVVKEPGVLEWHVVVEVHKGEWLRPRAVWMLEEKLNAYAAFILDGQMKILYPNSTPATATVVVASVDPIPVEAIRLLEQVAGAFEQASVRVTWDAAGGMPPEGVPPPKGFAQTAEDTKS
ncbi:MAG TPA: DUF6572 domain-containing protein [Polyangiaceae bacterium]|nr:DUF6572 domain-containing protein [Polyangiaceae bacterium]